MRNDEAIAPVVAVMLILVVIVTLLSIYNATYLPGLKQSAEIQHLHDVEEGILKFGSDIETAASLKRNDISFSQQIPLGGGDILLNSLKSGGRLQVQQEDEPYLTITIAARPQPIDLFLVNFSYWTVNNFWVDQGYTWQYGYVNITQNPESGGTWLQHATKDDVNKIVDSFGQTLITITDEGDQTVIEVVNFTADDKRFSSGNGVGMLKLNAMTDMEGTQYSNTTIDFVISPNTPLYNNLLGRIENKSVPVNLSLKFTNITVGAF